MRSAVINNLQELSTLDNSLMYKLESIVVDCNITEFADASKIQQKLLKTTPDNLPKIRDIIKIH